MSAPTIDCIYCHQMLGGKRHLDPDHPYVCNLCMEAIRTHQPLGCKQTKPSPPPQPDDRESSPKSKRKPKAVATVLALMLLPLAGCAVNWSGRVELDLDPTPLLTLQRPLPPAPPAEPQPLFTEP